MAAERFTGGFGGKLRAARERRGISLRDIANKTKISMGALEALERNDIARLPGGIFSRAFVRSYAVEVGLDPELAIQEFITLFPLNTVTVGYPNSSSIEDNEAVESDRRIASTVLGLLAVSLPIAGVVIYYSTVGMRTPKPSLPTANVNRTEASLPVAGGPSARLETPPVSPPWAISDPSPLAGAPPPLPAADRLMVGLTATRRAWVSATVDGQRVIGREMQPGEHQVLEVNRDVILSFGDAGAITVSLNGTPTRPLGQAGQVVTVEMNQSNFKSFLAVP